MRIKLFVPFLAAVLIAGGAVVAQAQGEEELTRGSFLTTRVTGSSGSTGAASAISATASTAATKTGSGKTSSGKTSGGRTSSGRTSSGRTSAGASVSTKNTTVKAGGSVKTHTNTTDTSYVPSSIGIGYTLYMRDSMGNAMRVDPTQEFHEGDRIRLSLETNTDGYLYIFHTENGGVPQLLYPDVRLSKGDNKIEAHVPYEIPWNEPGVENWFKFDANPANERLYVVLSRQPLPGVPVGSALVSYCDTNRCPWQPPTGIWAQVNANASAKVRVSKSKTYGQKQSQLEQVATTRGIGLDQSAPEPSVIRMSASSDAPVLVTAVELIHR